jgi:acetyltransferase
MEARSSSAPTGKWSPSSHASNVVKSIHAMLHPRNIVLVGATDKPGNYAERIWNNLKQYKFVGGLYPLNNKRETIWGVRCYKDFASLPDKPDHVLVLVPARFAIQVIRDAAAAGARSATIVTSGFSELQDDESQKLAAELQLAIRETGLAVTGPNCLGNLSAGERLFTNIDDRVVTMEAGPVAIAGQSGAIVMAIRQPLDPRNRGLSRRRAQYQGLPRSLQGRPRGRQAGDRAQARGVRRWPRRRDGTYRRAGRFDRDLRRHLDP